MIPDLPQFLRSKCADLTPYLGGDHVKNYPNLAHYTYSWRSALSDGKIYAIPIARPPINNIIMFRADLFEQAGVPLNKAPKDADEFKRVLQAVTRPQENQYGIAPAAAGFGFATGSQFSAIFRVPNNWRLDPAGKLVKDHETEEYKSAVGFARALWQLGVWHPNSPTYAAGAVLNESPRVDSPSTSTHGRICPALGHCCGASARRQDLSHAPVRV